MAYAKLGLRIEGHGLPADTDVLVTDESGSVIGRIAGVAGISMNLQTSKPMSRQTTLVVQGADWKVRTDV